MSFDLNYRESLWRGYGGHERAIAVNRGLVPMVDVLIGNEEDFSAALGFSVVSLLQVIGASGLQLDSAIEVVSCALTAAGLYASFTGDAKGWFNA